MLPALHSKAIYGVRSGHLISDQSGKLHLRQYWRSTLDDQGPAQAVKVGAEDRVLKKHYDNLLGNLSPKRSPRITLTLPARWLGRSNSAIISYQSKCGTPAGKSESFERRLSSNT